jgi:hypothetical protein
MAVEGGQPYAFKILTKLHGKTGTCSAGRLNFGAPIRTEFWAPCLSFTPPPPLSVLNAHRQTCLLYAKSRFKIVSVRKYRPMQDTKNNGMFKYF